VKKIPDESIVRFDRPDAESRQALVVCGRYEPAVESFMKVVLGFVKRARRDSQKPDEFFWIIAAKAFSNITGR